MPVYRLCSGVHVDRQARPIELNARGVERPPIDDDHWTDPEARKEFYPGDVFETDKDLSVHNTPGVTPRFERVDSAEAPIAKRGKRRIVEAAQQE